MINIITNHHDSRRYVYVWESIGSSAKTLSRLSLYLARQLPFRMTFKTDADEITGTVTSTNTNENELNGAPLGTIGFSLNYLQKC